MLNKVRIFEVWENIGIWIVHIPLDWICSGHPRHFAFTLMPTKQHTVYLLISATYLASQCYASIRRPATADVPQSSAVMAYILNFAVAGPRVTVELFANRTKTIW